jgi:predicted naringenin-chalcone synthase
LSRFSSRRPAHQISQARSLEWLAQAHAAAEATLRAWNDAQQAEFASRIKKVIERVGCSEKAIGSRGHTISDVGRTDWPHAAIYDVMRHAHGSGMGARTRVYANIVGEYFAQEYGPDALPPSDLIHVTCTGYAAPSGAQRVVAQRGWGSITRVTHAYHMGCYAALPAVRMALGYAQLMPDAGDHRSHSRVDIVHTELCSLHLDPADHALEQLVVQSLFADGLIRYSLETEPSGPALQVLALGERLIPDSADAMTWVAADTGMTMTLARDVPDRIATALRAFVFDLFAAAKIDLHSELPRTLFAVHPGGPRIIDSVRERLELSPMQVQTAREVLFTYGNMSSATLPHIWMQMLNDPSVHNGRLIASLAFGPGLTMCGALFRKV